MILFVNAVGTFEYYEAGGILKEEKRGANSG
jgi:hypothetical protein